MIKRKIKLSTPTEIRRALAKVANMVLNDEIIPKQATTFAYLCNTILQSIRLDEQEKRLEELEEYVDVIKQQDKENQKSGQWNNTEQEPFEVHS